MSLKSQQKSLRTFFCRGQGGFTLLELSLVMVIAGLILAALISAYLSWNNIIRAAKTKENMEIIMDAVSAYAARNYRIPCAADPAWTPASTEPFGAERGTNATGSDIPTAAECDYQDNNGNPAKGILPFHTLGLDASAAQDGYGNFYTYVVTDIFTRDPEDTARTVHARCRTFDWIEGAVHNAGGTLISTGRNVNPLKARFCCPETPIFSASSSDRSVISVFSDITSDGGANTNPTASVQIRDNTNWYATADTLADPYDAADPVSGFASSPVYDNIIYGAGSQASGFGSLVNINIPAVALISHGKNEYGRFLVDGTLNQFLPLGGGDAEDTNARIGTNQVFDIHYSDIGIKEYDDIVVWQSQMQLMARLRRDSCMVP